jgi:pimeloyl-ACP methyl ester carboxylesterase
MNGYEYINLPDGRKISYTEFGKKNGRPVFYFHGAPSSCYEALLIGNEAFEKYDLRIIAPNRPGIGESGFLPDRGFSQWVDDVVYMADALGIDKFSVLGFSGGSAYVSACAAKIPDRLMAAVIVSGGWQMNLPEAKKQLKMPFSIFWTIANRLPFLLPLLIRSMKESPKKPGKKETAETNKMLHPADFAALMQYDREAVLLKVIDEALLHGTKGAVYDTRLYVRKWDFQLEDIRFPVTMFHGEEDRNAPIGLIHAMLKHFPAAKLVSFPHEAHFSALLNHFDEIAPILRQ